MGHRRIRCAYLQAVVRVVGCAVLALQSSTSATAQGYTPPELRRAKEPQIQLLPDQGGAWEGPYDLPIVSNGEIVHATYLPPNSDHPSSFEGQVMLFTNRYPNCNASIDPTDHTQAWIWNPAVPDDVSSALDVPNTQRDDLWCSGHALTPSGDVVVFGGTDLTLHCYTGSRGAYRWSPAGWSQIGELDPLGPRWYPSVLELGVPGGEFLILGHFSNPFGPELTHQIFDSQSDTLSPLFTNGSADDSCQPTATVASIGSYPWAFWVSSGTVFVCGPESDSKYFGCRQPDGSFRWVRSLESACTRIDGSSVLMLDWSAGERRESIHILGGMSTLTGPGGPPANCDWNVLDSMEGVVNPRSGQPTQWTQEPTMRYGRRHSETLPLPDGTFLTVGGIGWHGPPNPSGRKVPRLQPECFDPVGKVWSQLNPGRRSRNYHSVAFLLLDGRVVSAGGVDSSHTLEIFSPPYLFHGPRPSIQSAPSSVTWCASPPPSSRGGAPSTGGGAPSSRGGAPSSRGGAPSTCGTFTLQVVLGQDTDPIAKVSLLRPASITHGMDCNQRYVELPILEKTQPDPTGNPLVWELHVQLPDSIDVAPPGWYMLFAVSTGGIPAVGRFVQVQ